MKYIDIESNNIVLEINNASKILINKYKINMNI